ncbi:MAG: helix-turn-helix domain-containing protein, partial [Deltaproteobacteria bacterium]|nr:helix-turn-helix domain-containing protein [Deltaproteobacteria bacterium]
METVGAYLKSAREKKDKSIQELAATTRISKSVLEAIEEDRDEMLPPMSYFKGFLRIYAKELGLDPDETISLYDMALKEKRWEPQKELKEDKQSRRRKKIRIAVAVVVGLAAALLLCFVLRDAGSPGALQQSAAVSAAPAVQPDAVRTVPAEPPVAVQPIPPVAAQPPQTPVTAEPVKREAPAASENRAEPGRDVIPSPAAQLTVRFVAHELSWIQLTVDDREPFDIM